MFGILLAVNQKEYAVNMPNTKHPSTSLTLDPSSSSIRSIYAQLITQAMASSRAIPFVVLATIAVFAAASSAAALHSLPGKRVLLGRSSLGGSRAKKSSASKTSTKTAVPKNIDTAAAVEDHGTPARVGGSVYLCIANATSPVGQGCDDTSVQAYKSFMNDHMFMSNNLTFTCMIVTPVTVGVTVCAQGNFIHVEAVRSSVNTCINE